MLNQNIGFASAKGSDLGLVFESGLDTSVSILLLSVRQESLRVSSDTRSMPYGFRRS